MRIALGASDTEKQLNVMASDDFSSFLSPANSRGWIQGSNTVKKTVSVPVKRLDSIFDDIAPKGSTERVFLKLDTQGFDLKVFEGAKGVLPNIVAMQSEVAMQPIYEGMPDGIESLNAFRAAGFGVTAFQRWPS